MLKHAIRISTIALLLTFITAAAAALAQSAPATAPPAGAAGGSGGPSKGFSDRPIGTTPLTATMAMDSLQFFRDKKFQGDMTPVSDVTVNQQWQDHGFGTKAKHFSSLRWNLPRGVIVTLFAESQCTGKCMTVWGSGEIEELSKWKMNDDLAGWSWNGVGGAGASASKAVKEGVTERPKYAKVAASVADDSLQCFNNRDVKGNVTAIEHITDKPANAYQEMPKGTSSLKWKLPEGVVVMFSEKKDGVGPNLAIWGSGQFDTFALWQMNDKLKFYSWQWVGER